MAKFCANCGQELKENTLFCPECGQKVQEQPMPQQSVQSDVSSKQQTPYQSAQAAYNPYGQQQYGQQQANFYQQSSGWGDNRLEALKWFSYKGRLNRQRYFFRGVGISIMTVVFVFIGAFWGAAMGMSESGTEGLSYLIASPFLVASIMNTIKRAHDLDKPGWIALLSVIPFVNVLIGIYLLFFKGTAGPNQYGDDPLMF